uniref:Uma2 domain-containing protein n=1 Tax=Brugia pahangi TaxID=6280 RepID=A0A0N4SZV0_BRUPA
MNLDWLHPLSVFQWPRISGKRGNTQLMLILSQDYPCIQSRDWIELDEMTILVNSSALTQYPTYITGQSKVALDRRHLHQYWRMRYLQLHSL